MVSIRNISRNQANHASVTYLLVSFLRLLHGFSAFQDLHPFPQEPAFSPIARPISPLLSTSSRGSTSIPEAGSNYPMIATMSFSFGASSEDDGGVSGVQCPSKR